jgi:hypothetical protein
MFGLAFSGKKQKAKETKTAQPIKAKTIAEKTRHWQE